MGKKQQKDPDTKSQSNAVLPQSGIFNTLFGDSQDNNADVSSLFSNNNPFRRKPTESKSADGTESFDFWGSDKKRDEERTCNLESASTGRNREDEEGEAPMSSVLKKKSKREKTQNANVCSNEEGRENPKSSEVKKKKKREKDEIEKQYEEKKYGVLPKEEENGNKNKKVGEKRKKLEDSSDAMVSKEGFDDENKLSRTVFVGNLPLKVKRKTILKEFGKFGEVESARIRSVPIVDSKKTRKGAILQKQINENASSVHAYVVFKTDESAVASLAHNMSLIGGNHIRVDRACPPCKKLKGQSSLLYDPRRTVFVGNLPFNVKDEELYQLFASMNNFEGSVEAVRVVRDPHVNVGKGIAYVLFKTREAANRVIKKGGLKLRDRELRASHVKSDSSPSKQKNPSSSSAVCSPAKKFASSNRKSSLSYQGLRATKSDSNKKKVHQKSPVLTGTKPKSRGKGEKLKERSQKRPAVAARKAKAKAIKESGVKQARTKRKQDGRTSRSFRQKKKIKRF